MQGARVLSSQKESTTQKNRTENKQTIHTFPAKKKKKLSLFIREKLFFFFGRAHLENNKKQHKRNKRRYRSSRGH